MRPVLLILFLLPLAAYSQTKKIAFKSHSGNPVYFHAALEAGDMIYSNFGVAPDATIKTAQLDSVILICDTIAVMVTSTVCRKRTEKTISRWKAGKDTVINHPLFSKGLSLDSIKKLIKTQFHFQNPVEQTIFVGFEEKLITRQRERRLQAAFMNPHNKDQGGNTLFFLASILVGLVFLKSITGKTGWTPYHKGV